LADDIATTLSYFPALSIRPFATTSRSLLQDVLSDFLEVEGILSKLQIVEALQLTAKQMKLYKEIVARVNELVRD
jgi:SNF2 family DNA or RNA helicase